MKTGTPRILWLWVYGLGTFLTGLLIWVISLPYLATISATIPNLILSSVSLFFVVITISVSLIARPKRMTVRAGCGLMLVLFAMLEAAYFSPYWVLIHMKVSLDRNDSQMLSRYIDFESVRKSVRSEWLDLVKQKYSRRKGRGRGKYLLKAAYGVAAINAIVTPGGLKSLLEGATPSDLGLGRGGDVSYDRAKEHIYSATAHYDYKYRFPDSFTLRVRNISVGGHSNASFHLKRSGLFSWKLVSVSLKMD